MSSEKVKAFWNKPPSPATELIEGPWNVHGIRLWVKRDDLLRDTISGNKWRKLKHNLLAAHQKGEKTIITKGGAFSNHLLAVAEVGAEFGFKTIAFVRGEENYVSNPTLSKAVQLCMKLIFVPRDIFRDINGANYPQFLKMEMEAGFYLPEGGTNCLALQGCAELVSELRQQVPITPPVYICVACGTGGTAAGIIKGADDRIEVLGIPVLKGNFMKNNIENLLHECAITPRCSWSVNEDFHFGGYAKYNRQLIDFINGFYEAYGIPLDPIYTGKLFFGVFNLIEAGYFPEGANIVVIHTGGLQGVQGFNRMFGDLIHWQKDYDF